jgi:Fur family ferric uptake transcriptional regulator
MRDTVERKTPDDTLAPASFALACSPASQIAAMGESRMETQDLRKAGLKVTHPRMRILEILETSSGKHLTAEDIYRRLLEHHDDIGLATVYRVLTQFEAAGLVAKHNFEGGQAVYEIERGKHHDHMVDVDSGKVTEFVSEEIERLQREVAEKHGFEIVDHSLVLYVRAKRKK